jgi:hypothetical protein
MNLVAYLWVRLHEKCVGQLECTKAVFSFLTHENIRTYFKIIRTFLLQILSEKWAFYFIVFKTYIF